jgi:hypothetical protein
MRQSAVRAGELFAPVFFRAEEEVYYMQNDAPALAALTCDLIEHCQTLGKTVCAAIVSGGNVRVQTVGLGAQRQRHVGNAPLPPVGNASPRLSMALGSSFAAAVAAAALPAATPLPPTSAQQATSIVRVVRRNTAPEMMLPVAPPGSPGAAFFYPPSVPGAC